MIWGSKHRVQRAQQALKGVGDRADGKKGGGLEREGKGPFSPLSHFSPSPSPPFLAPAAQARQGDEVLSQSQHYMARKRCSKFKICIHLLLVVFAESNSRYTFTALTFLDHEQCPIFLLRSASEYIKLNCKQKMCCSGKHEELHSTKMPSAPQTGSPVNEQAVQSSRIATVHSSFLSRAFSRRSLRSWTTLCPGFAG